MHSSVLSRLLVSVMRFPKFRTFLDVPCLDLDGLPFVAGTMTLLISEDNLERIKLPRVFYLFGAFDSIDLVG